MLGVLGNFHRHHSVLQHHQRALFAPLSTAMANSASEASAGTRGGGMSTTQEARSKAADRNSGFLRSNPVRRQMSTGDPRPPPDLNIASQLAGFAGGSQGTPHGATSVPIFQTATFDCRSQDEFDYTRSGNPTRGALEELCRNIEHAHRAFAFSTGMAALMSTVQLLRPGDHVLASADIYGGMHRLLLHAVNAQGIDVKFVKTWDLQAVQAALERSQGQVKHMYVESPTNPQMQVSDLRALARLCTHHGVLLIVDNSIMSPILMRPLDLGADIVVHSATKFLAGHSDVMAGIVAVKDPDVSNKIAFVQNALGTALAPFDCFLVLRGAKTMHLRVAAAQANAVEVARYLTSNPYVTKVNYLDASATETSAQAKVHFGQATGGGSVLSFETGNVDLSRALVDQCRLFKNTVSFGSCSSLIELPGDMSHASIPEQLRTMPSDLVRLAVGIEDLGDLIDDLSYALQAAAKQVNATSQQKSTTSTTAPLRQVDALPCAGTFSPLPSPPGMPAFGLSQIPEAMSGQHQLQQQITRTHLRSRPLGESLPPMDEHAVGVSMPLWDDVVKYEQGCPVVHQTLMAGYPRFVLLTPVKELFAKADELFCKPGEQPMAVPSARVALRLQNYLMSQGVVNTRIHDLHALGVFAVTFPTENADIAKRFWQHTGEIVSSRLASAALKVMNRTSYEMEDKLNTNKTNEAVSPAAAGTRRDPRSPTAVDTGASGALGVARDGIPRGKRIARDSLRARIAGLLSTDGDNVFLYPTGMAAINSAHRLLKLTSHWKSLPLPTVVFGFPYLDTLKLSQMAAECIFFGRGDDEDFSALEEYLEKSDIGISGLLCEFPSNPLLLAPDLDRLRVLADKYKFPIVCDDTVAGFANVDLLQEGGVDILCSSLTKQFSGSGNVMGGSIVLNTQSRWYSSLHARLARDHEELLWEEDAEVLLNASWDLTLRNAKSNATTETITAFLRQHPRVDTVYYPKYSQDETGSNTRLYEKWQRKANGAGYGSLFSVKFKNPLHSQAFYDALDTPKGPGFGTNFTLACPYTMIAHFGELEWAAHFGVDPSLVRVWIGQEETEELLQVFGTAMKAVEEASA